MNVLLLCFVLLTTAHVSAVTSQPSQADWVVAGTEVVENKSIILNGNLVVRGGGSLTLRNVTLTMNNQYRGQYGISVEPGGSMFIYNSIIRSSNLANRFTFIVEGSNFLMKDSQLHGVGWFDSKTSNPTFDPALQLHGGLRVETNGAVMEGNLISQNAIGLILSGSGVTISGNNFTRNELAQMSISRSNNNKIVGNSFHQDTTFDSWEIYMGDSNNSLFYNNTMTFTPPPVIGGYWPGVGGFNLFGSSNNVFSNNSIFSGQPFAGLGRNSNNTIINNNIIVQGDSAIFMQEAAYTRILGNRIQLKPKPVPGNVAGITLMNAPNSTIAYNIVTGNGTWPDGKNPALWYPIFLAFSPNSYVLNNNITVVTATASIYLFSSMNGTVSGNLVANGAEGLWLKSRSDNNRITNNEIHANSTYSKSHPFLVIRSRSILLDSSSNNVIYGNNFYDGGGGPYDSGRNNSWSYQGTGNYWNIHQGTSPFRIPPNGIDNYPLTNPVQIKPVEVVTMTQPSAPPFKGPYTRIDVTQDMTIANQQITVEAGGIYVKNGGRLVISNSTLVLGTKASFGLDISQGGSLIIDHSTIIGGSGIFVRTGGNLTIVRSTLLVGQRETFPIFFDGMITIDHTAIISKGSFGFFFENRAGGDDDTLLAIKDSRLENPSTFWQLGGSVESLHGKLVIENTIMEGAVAYVSFNGISARVVNNTFTGAALGFDISSNQIVFSRNFIDASGVNLAGSSVFVADNVLNSWSYGINLQSVSGVISGNKVSSAQGFGLSITSYNATISNNTVTNTLSPSSSLLIRASDSLVEANVVINSTGGIGIGGDRNRITNNSLTNISGHGFDVMGYNNTFYGNVLTNVFQAFGIFSGNGTVIYHNNFIEVNQAVYDKTMSSKWDYKDEGNYWSSYKGVDSNLDGIGDTPYVIGKDSQGREIRDNFPFMRNNGWLTRFWLTVKTNFPSISFRVNGTEYKTGSDGTLSLRLGYIANYEIGFAQDISISEGSRLHFVKWDEGAVSNVQVIRLSSNSTLQAIYVKQYLLKVVSDFSETTGSAWYDEGVQASFSVKDVRVSVSPQLTKVFKGWTGDVTTSTPFASVTMDGAKTISATWQDELTEKPEEALPSLTLNLLIAVGAGGALAALIGIVLLRRKRSLTR